ncbi:glycosyltransferase family 2 protein [Providencia rettgeri]|uniref:glycosyltransferase family 2 protein n=1 Tax=Providencia sp. PROV137 TaxID=2949847 RepID=UPI00234AB048|nr:glycosyltransferase family A protein [Providencia sp. PROV137]ELR5109039.1 glycosyltransferase family 2 protein [Providencia rettgeri]ELR5284249.1 glycosyltransferase family 2 protein [Providencia rettgeri]
MTNNKISVVIPLYNGEKVIARALDSIRNQTIMVDEIIIVNDGSTDNSINEINNYIKLHCFNIIKLINKENGGVSSARNEGIKYSKNEIIAFLDCDDEWVSNKTEIQLQYIDDVDVVVVGGNHFQQKLKFISLRKCHAINQIKLNDLLFKNYFQPSTVMVKKSAAIEINGFDNKQKYAEEGQFFYKLSTKGKLIHINTQLVIYDGGGKSGFGHSGLSKNIIEMEKGELSNLKIAKEELNINLFLYWIAVFFSIVKFIRRIILNKFNRG